MASQSPIKVELPVPNTPPTDQKKSGLRKFLQSIRFRKKKEKIETDSDKAVSLSSSGSRPSATPAKADYFKSKKVSYQTASLLSPILPQFSAESDTDLFVGG